MAAQGQLPLALELPRNASFGNFVGSRAAPAVRHLREIAGGQRAESIWLAGPSGTGKTHLLSAACRTAAAAELRPMYLALDRDGDPAVLDRLDDIDLLALDDVHGVAGVPEWESALFPVFDARLQRGGLLLAANRSPGECGFGLPDLASRAGSVFIYRLDPLTDDELQHAVIGIAAQKGLELDEPAASYLLLRLNRDLGALTDWLGRIDRVALAEQRRITIPLLRQVIARDSAGAG